MRFLRSGWGPNPRDPRALGVALDRVTPRLPISYPWFWRSFRDAAIKAGVGPIGTHTLRRTYRSWIDLVGTSVAVQQKLMRHSDIRTTMNVYGDVVDD